ncbi:MAG: outer membrane protein assembly factor BamE [Bdellovibrionales bacterium]|nr:outer membrane protein assembly factor BamE [Bdellovibrionales bacterium]
MKSQNLKILVLSLTAALVMSSCATMSGAESKENMAKLKYGMSESQVLSVLGSPDSVVRPSKTDDRWIYEFKSNDKKGRNLFVDFKNNQLIKAGELNGRDIAATEESRESGICTHHKQPEFQYESLCIK